MWVREELLLAQQTVMGQQSMYFFDGCIGNAGITHIKPVGAVIVWKAFNTWEMAPKEVILQFSEPAQSEVESL